MMAKKHQDFSTSLEKILRSDNKSRFVTLLKESPSEVTNSLVNKCVDHGAKKCLFALLRGEKPILDCARLLAQHMDSINDIAWTFLKHGGLEQFVALLLVAQEKVMATFDSGLDIRERITNEIDSLPKVDINGEQEEYIGILKDALKLLDVFERAGKDLSLYCSSMQKYVYVHNVLVDLCGLLKKSGVQVTRWDLGIDSQFLGFRGLEKLNMYEMSGPYDDSCLKVCPTPCASWPYYYKPYLSGGSRAKRPMVIPQLAYVGSEPKMYSTIAYNTRNISKSLHHAGIATSPRQLNKSLHLAGPGTLPRQLAHFTMKLTTKVIRFL